MLKRAILCVTAVLVCGCYPRPTYEGGMAYQASAVRYEVAPAKQSTPRFRLSESSIYGLSNRDIFDLDVVLEMPVVFDNVRIPAGSRAKIYATHKAYSILGGREKILYATFPECNQSDVLTLRFDSKGGVYTLTDIYWGLPSARGIEFIWSARGKGNYLLVTSN